MVAVLEKSNLARDIELCSNQKIGILFNEHEAIGKYHEQQQSPLFSVLPRELRDLIWEFTLAPYEDQAHPFASTEYYYRPGHTARLKTDTTLLRTCRRMWLEANAMPMLQAEHSFYYYRAAPEARNPEWMAKLTDHNRLNFGKLHFFVQMYAIEGLQATPGRLRKFFLETQPKPGDFQPRTFHVTLRHTDWWNWESEEPLKLRDSWVQNMLDSPDLRSTQTFKLELETLDYKMSQLKPILERLRKMQSKEFETHLVDGKPVKTKFVLSPHEEHYTWTGPTTIDGQTFAPYAGMADLKYHVTTLTWKLNFPDLPGAFIPRMRRAPRIPPPEDQKLQPHEYGYGSSNPNPWPDRRRRNHPMRPQTAVPYADYDDHKNFLRLWRRRNRRAHPSKYDEQFLLGQLTTQAVRRVTRKQAQDHEEFRRKEFGSLMAAHLPKKWEAQKSLLTMRRVEPGEVVQESKEYESGDEEKYVGRLQH